MSDDSLSLVEVMGVKEAFLLCYWKNTMAVEVRSSSGHSSGSSRKKKLPLCGASRSGLKWP